MTLALMALVTVVQTVRGVRAGGMGLPFFEAAGVIVAAVAATSLVAAAWPALLAARLEPMEAMRA